MERFPIIFMPCVEEGADFGVNLTTLLRSAPPQTQANWFFVGQTGRSSVIMKCTEPFGVSCRWMIEGRLREWTLSCAFLWIRTTEEKGVRANAKEG